MAARRLDTAGAEPRDRRARHGARVVGALLAVLLALARGAHADPPARLSMTEVAPGIHVHFGRHEPATPDNLGDIANIGFIVGSRCVAVIDSGGSLAIGQSLRKAVAAATSLPICYVVNSHMHPDHVMGNAAFEAPGVTFVGHAKLPAAMAARANTYLATVEREVGDAGGKSRVVVPTLLVHDSLELDLGERRLRLQAHPTAHTDNDLTVLDETTGTLWLSDLLFIERIPIVDGSARGWLRVLNDVRASAPARVVPGHGPVPERWQEAIAAEERYLNLLIDETRAAIKAGRRLKETVETVGLAERSNWQLFDLYHRRNATAAYAELEWE